MRKFVVTLMASLLSCSAAFAFWPDAAASSLEIGVGYRQDKLEWQTYGSPDSGYSYGDYYDYYDYYGYGGYDNYGYGPGVRSVLKWKNLNIWQIEARGKYVTCDNIYLRASGDYGWVVNGRNTDTDYITFGDDYYDSYYGYGCGCDDEIEFAKSRSKVKGHVYDAKIALGYQFKMCDDSFSISPLIGYSWHGQHFEDSHLQQDLYLGGETFVIDDYYYDYDYDYDYYGYDYYSSNCKCPALTEIPLHTDVKVMTISISCMLTETI